MKKKTVIYRIKKRRIQAMCKKAVGTGKTERTALKAAEPEKRAFSLPYISHNVHYTKYYNVQKTDPLLSPRGCGSEFAEGLWDHSD